MNLIQLSKAVSRVLRHEPWLYELELDDEGWVDLQDLILALQHQRPEWKGLIKADLRRMIENSDKQRHEIDGDRIRALYGHSLPGRLRRKKAPPPALLYHGTRPFVEEMVVKDGLLPMGRQYVHLSTNVEIAVQVGKRKDRNPVILEVAAKEAFESGVDFYIGNDIVWLADRILPMFIEVLQR